MITEEVAIINKLGLHARAAAKLVTIASAYKADVQLALNGKQVNGKSIMGVMMLAAAKGTKVTLTISGNDEEQAMAALIELINNKFDEEQ
ncbi:MAG: HPr family phosphocarrier protein [Gammaproteobacteria bacterium]|nr:HPr family phosphocarrier protein [Gammaproteobacteria bacterium]MDH5777733.1 HPr family phosphocarrier protein [Gammaproteobacteria bacterium]